ncbi:hypothetical protein COEREDRAFT_12171 [Coemansia reversa NRRL 1564]|uniref:Uncharacterized protein n=1 Tax=Coemansia reversa (strain ATCC 12441 / NRRL 1564) TaxID=763665 RepID=A0A2G5B1A9_COERN|nr:hypothetical protein COEREDRAFT_12171 [Coemansia reversa NRRL 1564]|eukprot:PIA12796.1 hypothetical protein COEREDRAFT_12171 [Coemansia reversa NRRL 1564]
MSAEADGKAALTQHHGISMDMMRFLLSEFYITDTREESLQKFLDVDNPRPHKQDKKPVIKSHAVLRFNNGKCEERVVNSMTGWLCPRIIDRKLAAYLNFSNIVDELREHSSVPGCFMRPRRTGNVPAAAPDDGPPMRRQRTE